MKIENLKLKNFKKFEEKELSLSDVMVLIGRNGAGKSSILSGLRFLLTGEVFPSDILEGEDHLEVSVVLDSGIEIGRELYLPESFAINEKEFKEKQFQAAVTNMRALAKDDELCVLEPSNKAFSSFEKEALWEFLITGKTEKKMRGVKQLKAALSDGTVFYQRKSKPSRCTVDGKKVPLKVFQEILSKNGVESCDAAGIVTSSEVMTHMEMPDFSKFLMENMPVSMNYSDLLLAVSEKEDIGADLKSLIGEYFKDDTVSFDDIEKAYRQIYDQRTIVYRKMEEAKKRSLYEGMLPLPSTDNISGQMSEINQKLGAASQLEKSWAVYNRQVADRAKMLETRKAVAQKYNSMKDVLPLDENYVQTLKAQERTTRDTISFLQSQISSLKQAAVPVQTILRNLESTVCPLCDKLTCTTDKTGCKHDFEEALRANTKLLLDAEGKLQVEVLSLNKISENLEAVRKQEQAWALKVSLYNQYKEIEKMIPEEPVKPDSIPDTSSYMKKLRKLEELLRQVNLYKSCLEEERKYMASKKEYELYTEAIRLTEKKGGFSSSILENVLKPFTEHCNEFLKDINVDLKVSFEMKDSGLEVLCYLPGKNSVVPVTALSTGERAMISFSFMDMVSSLTGIGIVLFDNMECLDEEAFESLLKAVLKNRDRYDHVVMSAVEHEGLKKIIERYESELSVCKF